GFVAVRQKMIGDGSIAVEKRAMPGEAYQDRVVALRDPDLAAFTAFEIALVDEFIQGFWGESGNELSRLTHRYRGWLVAKALGDPIPYQAVFLSDEPPT